MKVRWRYRGCERVHEHGTARAHGGHERASKGPRPAPAPRACFLFLRARAAAASANPPTAHRHRHAGHAFLLCSSSSSCCTPLPVNALTPEVARGPGCCAAGVQGGPCSVACHASARLILALPSHSFFFLHATLSCAPYSIAFARFNPHSDRKGG
jgi:hypothetical protein